VSSFFPASQLRRAGAGNKQPVGHDGESIEAFPSAFGVGSFVYLPAIGVRTATYQAAPVNLADLDPRNRTGPPK